MRVLHVVGAFWPAERYGGPVVSVKELCKAVQGAGVSVDVVTTDADGPTRSPVTTDRWSEVEGLRVRYFRRIGKSTFVLSPDLARYVLAISRFYDVIHITSTFQFPSSVAGAAARQAGTPYIVSPRGSLQPWSLRQKRWKKAPYWNLVERYHLMHAAALHATAEIEAQALRELLPSRPVVIVPNGVFPVAVPTIQRKRRQVVFLGRVHPKKGLDILMPALSLCASRWPDLETVVAGPDDDAEWARVSDQIKSLNPVPNVRYVGPVYGDAKFALLAESTVFVLPSRSENFGQAVVEAMACGTPVVVSTNCPWRCVQEAGAGYWVENSVQEVAAALSSVLESEERQHSMGEAARELAKMYSWQAAGRAMADHYESLLGSCPGSVSNQR
jgi:glycosyltransferase involved in cell wall biosynthesis